MVKSLDSWRRRRQLPGVVLGLLIFVGTPSSALADSHFELVWSDQATQLLADIEQKRDELLDTVQSLIPEKLGDTLDRKVEVTFGDPNDFPTLTWGSCGARASPLRPQDLARLADPQDWLGSHVRYRKLILNPAFAETIRRDFAHPRPSCMHGTDYNLLLATFVHELARAYDLLADSDATLVAQQQLCVRGTFSDTAECQEVLKIKTRVSGRSPWRSLMNFYETPFGTESKQRSGKVLLAADDPRLSSTPSVAFTAAMEDFLVEPSFYCRHPGVYEFLAAHFGTRPTVHCEPKFDAPIFDQPGKTLVIDPKRVYRVEYIDVLPGSNGLVERFGHAMLRIVACAPERDAPGPECLADTRYHYILTFYSQDEQGQSVARLLLYDARTVLSGYIEDEHRSLRVLPLTLTPEQLATLLGTAWEWNRNYRGRWYDLTNNCVTHTLDFLRAAIQELEFEKFPILTPANLFEKLQTVSGLGTGARPYRVDRISP